MLTRLEARDGRLVHLKEACELRLCQIMVRAIGNDPMSNSAGQLQAIPLLSQLGISIEFLRENLISRFQVC